MQFGFPGLTGIEDTETVHKTRTGYEMPSNPRGRGGEFFTLDDNKLCGR